MLIIEKLKKEDIPELLRLYEQLGPFKSCLSESVKAYEETVNNDDYLLLAAKESGEIVGSMLGICCRGVAMPFLVVEDVIVKDGLRGKEIGRKLMESLDEFAKSKKCAYSILVSSGFRTGAHKFYEKLGFTDSVMGFRKWYKTD